MAAGGPLLAEENVEDVIAVPETLGRGADFLLTVHGDSMIEAGILDGDTIVVQRRDDARSGDVVVALVGDDESADEATVKTFYREGDGRVRLQPENSGARADLRRPRPDPRQGRGGVPEPAMSAAVTPLARTLDHELLALARGASLECLCCGEFVMRLRGVLRLPGVPLAARRRTGGAGGRPAARRLGGVVGASRRGHARETARFQGLHCACRPGGRGRLRPSEESPDTAGQDAGETPGGESRRKVEQRGDRRSYDR